ncbi:MAG: hypothetical protein L6R43_05415 [Planctomycetes bacterium]|nr:hypothetical protein [Planctomycetota bacterium]
MRIEVDHRALDGLEARLKAQLQAGIRNGVHAAGVDAVAKVREAITTAEPRPPVDTGALRTGIVSVVAPDGMSVRIGPAPPVAERGAVMDLGRRPGQRRPPVEPLARWALRKGLIGGFTRQGRRRKVKGEEKLAHALGYALARSIQKKGIRARNFIRRALPGIRRDAPAIIRAAIGRALQGPPTGGGSAPGGK